MNNIYINIAFGILVTALGILPGVGEAYSYAYNPGYTDPVNIVNNNYNNNVNTNTNSAPIVYTGTYTSSNVAYIARHNLPSPTYVAPRHPHGHGTVTCTTCTYTHPTPCGISRYHRCGAVVSIAEATIPKPVCTLVPAITSTGAVELQWTTYGATVAYIDAGIGHVGLVSGNRLITPQKDTTYNMTVINDAGISGTCTAKVKVTISDPVDPVDPGDGDGDGGGLFGDTFRAIALPIGVAFLILIILLIVIMSKVKNAH